MSSAAIEVRDLRMQYGTTDAVRGVGPAFAAREWPDRIGLASRSCGRDPLLSVRESLSLFAGFSTDVRPVDEIVEPLARRDTRDAPLGVCRRVRRGPPDPMGAARRRNLI